MEKEQAETRQGARPRSNRLGVTATVRTKEELGIELYTLNMDSFS